MYSDFKVALVVPFSSKPGLSRSMVEYLGFGYLAGVLRKKGIKVDIIDAYVYSIEIECIASKLENENYNLIGFTAMSSEFYSNIKKILSGMSPNNLKNVHITVGGYYSSSNKERLLYEDQRINSLMFGEGELTLVDLIDSLVLGKSLADVKGLIYRSGNDVYCNTSRNLMTEEELTALPYPVRDTLPKVLERGGSAEMLSSRGCYGACTFCGVNAFYSNLNGSKWRGRDPENVVNEMEEIIHKYGIKYIYFADEEFIGCGEKGKSRARRIAELIIDRKLDIKFCIYCRVNSVDESLFSLLREAGLDRVFLGVEFGVQKILDFYNKGIRLEESIRAINILEKLKVNISVGYIMFEPNMTITDLRDNFKFYATYIKLNLKRFLVRLAVYPNSEAFLNLKKHIEFEDKISFDYLVGDHISYKFKDTKVEFMYKLFIECLPTISPSKRYSKIMKLDSGEEQKILLKNWGIELSEIILNLIDDITNQKNIEDIEYVNWKQEFINKLIKWDNDLLELS